MNRRTVLAALGATAGSLSGCVAHGDDEQADGTGTPTAPDTPRGTPPANSGGLDEFDPAFTYEHVDVGNRTGVDDRYGPHDVRVWNATAERHVINLRVVDRLAETTTYRDGHVVPADAALEASLLEPSRYLVQAWAPALDVHETVRVSCSLFDCNASVTSIGVFENGRTGSSVSSTLAGCPSPDC